MPKKSKRQKMLSDSRRLHVPDAADMSTPATFSFTYKHKNSTVQPAATAVDMGELTAIRHDLTKTLVLAAIAIAVELALYWFGRGRI